MITGILAVILLLFLLLKVIFRFSPFKKANKIFHKLHIPMGILFIVLLLIHILTTLPVWDTRSPAVSVTGMMAFFLIFMMLISWLLRKRMKKRWISWHRTGAVCILFLVIGHIAFYWVDFLSYQNQVARIYLTDLDLSTLKDGCFTGEYDVGYIYAKVSVVLDKGNITQINIIEHKNERGSSAERIVNDMVALQKIHVDTVTGATNSSLVIEKAVENALQKAL